MKLASKENIEAPSLSDNELWTELKKGNPDVLGVLFSRFYNDLYFYGTQLVPDKNFKSVKNENIY